MAEVANRQKVFPHKKADEADSKESAIPASEYVKADKVYGQNSLPYKETELLQLIKNANGYGIEVFLLKVIALKKRGYSLDELEGYDIKDHEIENAAEELGERSNYSSIDGFMGEDKLLEAAIEAGLNNLVLALSIGRGEGFDKKVAKWKSEWNKALTQSEKNEDTTSFNIIREYNNTTCIRLVESFLSFLGKKINTVDMRVTDSEGKNILHYSANCSDALLIHEISELSKKSKLSSIVFNGPHINEKDNIGNTPLHYAISSENPMAVEKFLEAGASIDIPNNAGHTLLHYAIKGDPSILELLLLKNKKKIKPELFDSAKQLAEQLGNEKALELLYREKGNITVQRDTTITGEFYLIISKIISVLKNFIEPLKSNNAKVIDPLNRENISNNSQLRDAMSSYYHNGKHSLDKMDNFDNKNLPLDLGKNYRSCLSEGYSPARAC